MSAERSSKMRELVFVNKETGVEVKDENLWVNNKFHVVRMIAGRVVEDCVCLEAICRNS